MCGSKIENTFSCWGIVSPLSRRRSVWSVRRTACARKSLISVTVQAEAPFAASAGRSPSTRRKNSRQRSRYAATRSGLARRVDRTLLKSLFTVFVRGFHCLQPATSCAAAARPVVRIRQRIASHRRLTSVG